MMRLTIPLLVLCFAPLVAFASPAPTIPGTPAGVALQAWLSAFNSGKREAVESYVTHIDPSQSVDGMIAFFGQTGGFDLVTVESEDALHVQFRVRERASATLALGALSVSDSHPQTVATFSLRAVPNGVTAVSVSLDSSLRRKVLDGVKQNLTAYYVDAAVATQMSLAVEAHYKAGEYNSITGASAFADRLTQDLRTVSHDLHLRVDFNPYKMPPRAAETSNEEEVQRKAVEHNNCDFASAQILAGNVGYLKWYGFEPPSLCAPTVVAAMAFVAHADALILDMRDNRGGDPGMVTFIASYLFDRPTHLNDLYNRHDDSTVQFWTLPYVPGSPMTTQPVFVLTSKVTFSAAEEFTYDLQSLKRATIVGERTGGGAHPVGTHVIADYFSMQVPAARAINPITKTDWEGVGVTPDVQTSADHALAAAEELAHGRLRLLKDGTRATSLDQ